MKHINLGDPSPVTYGKRPSLKQAFLTGGGHKRTLSGVVKDVSALNKTTITNQEYNFADLLGDINYINEDGSKGEGETESLTKRQLAAR